MTALALHNLTTTEARHSYKAQHADSDAVFCINGVGFLLKVALLVIGSVTAAGLLNGVVAGGCIVGLTIPLLIAKVASVCCSNGPTKAERVDRIFGIIAQIALIVIGSLAIAGVLAPTVAGWCVVGPTVVALALACIACYVRPSRP